MVETKIEHIRQQVNSALEHDSRIPGDSIAVEIADDLVILKGAVPTLAAKMAAEEDVLAIKGVRAVSNLLMIEGGVDIVVAEDNQIRTQLSNAFSAADIDTHMIHFEVDDAVVTLHGSVRSRQEKERIREISFAAFPEVVIRSLLGIVGSGNAQDTQLADRIYRALEQVRDIDIQMIDVDVENGRVTLLGKVAGWNPLFACENAVRNVEGVTQVVNELIIAIF